MYMVQNAACDGGETRQCRGKLKACYFKLFGFFCSVS